MGKQEQDEWRVIRFKGYIFLVSPDGYYVSRECDFDEATKIAKEENVKLELGLLVREGKI